MWFLFHDDLDKTENFTQPSLLRQKTTFLLLFKNLFTCCSDAKKHFSCNIPSSGAEMFHRYKFWHVVGKHYNYRELISSWDKRIYLNMLYWLNSWQRCVFWCQLIHEMCHPGPTLKEAHEICQPWVDGNFSSLNPLAKVQADSIQVVTVVLANPFHVQGQVRIHLNSGWSDTSSMQWPSLITHLVQDGDILLGKDNRGGIIPSLKEGVKCRLSSHSWGWNTLTTRKSQDLLLRPPNPATLRSWQEHTSALLV